MKVKKILSMLLSVVMILSMLPMAVSAEVTQFASISDFLTENEERATENIAEEADIYKIISEGIGTSKAYLQEQLTELHEVGDIGYGFEWYVIAMLRAGKTIADEIQTEYYQSVTDEIKTWTPDVKPTDVERVGLALTLMAKDITNVEGVNLAELIYSSTRLTEGANELAYALIALDAAEIEIPETADSNRDTIITNLLGFQATDGGFCLTNNENSDVDMTAICLQALAPYKNDETVATAIENGISYLKNKISDDCNYSDNSNSTAQVLLALAALKIDVTESENGFGESDCNIITALDEYRNADGNGYVYGDEVNVMSTVQVMQAYDAYRKAQQEDILYWDFSIEGKKYDDDNAHIEDNTDQEVEAAAPATVYVTIASDGTISADKNGGYMAQTPVTVTDWDKDGTLTVDEALYAAHEAYYQGGAEAGYSSYSGEYGLSLAVLWGKGTVGTTAAAGYWLNNASCWSLGDAVKDGDYLTAFNYYDTVGWSDAYSCFAESKQSVTAGNSVTLTLKYISGYDAENYYTPIFSPCNGANVIFLGSNNGIQKNLTTDADGQVKISFSKSSGAGSYYVMACKDDGSVVPAVCKINVAASDNSSTDGNSFQGSYSGSSAYTVKFETNGASSVKSQKVSKNSTLDKPENPTKDGYIFDGWYTDKELMEEYDFTAKVTKSFTLCAKWTKIEETADTTDENILIVFTDVETGAWYEKAAVFAAKNNILNGVSEAEFAPNRNITRAMFITALYRLENPKSEAAENKFTDVADGQWYADAVIWATENGIVTGISETEFAPDADITREQIATILYRYAALGGYDVTDFSDLTSYTDFDKISVWATDALKWAAANELINGTSKTALSPDALATRAQAAAILMRFYENTVG